MHVNFGCVLHCFMTTWYWFLLNKVLVQVATHVVTRTMEADRFPRLRPEIRLATCTRTDVTWLGTWIFTPTASCG